MSALLPKADIRTQLRDVRFVPKADISPRASFYPYGRQQECRRNHLQVAGRSLSDETPRMTLNASEPCSDSGCKATVRPDPPTSTLAPPPTTNPTSPDAPT